MSLSLRLIFLIAVILLALSLAFSLYSHFLVDYSFESLQLALTFSEKSSEQTSPYRSRLYADLVNRAAADQALQGDMDYRKFALLESAARSMKEKNGRAGVKKAGMYLNQLIKEEKNNRPIWMNISESLYQHFRQGSRLGFSLLNYFKKKTSKQAVSNSYDYTAGVLLTAAEEKVKERNFSEAAELYRKYISEYPQAEDRGYVMIALADALVPLSRIKEAQTILSEVALDFAGLEEGDLANNFLKRVEIVKKTKKIISEMDSSPKLNGAAADEFNFNAALAYLRAEEFDNASRLLRQLLVTSNPELKLKVEFYLGWILKSSGDYAAAEKVFAQALRSPRLNKQYEMGMRAELANIYQLRKNSQAALEQYQLIEQLSRKDAANAHGEFAWDFLAQSEKASIYFFDLNDPASAKKCLGELTAAGLDATDYSFFEQEFKARESLRSRAFTALQNQQLHLAKDLFEENNIREPDDSWTYGGLSGALSLLGSVQDAVRAAEKGYRLHPDEFTASTLAYAYTLSGKDDDAIDLYQEAIGHNAKYPVPYFNEAWLWIKKSEYQKGLEALETLEKQNSKIPAPLKAKIHNNKGCAYWGLGETDKAEREFHDALSLSPGSSLVKQNLNAISTNRIPEPAGLRD